MKKKGNYKLTENDKRYIVENANKKSVYEIADEIGCSEMSVRNHIKRQNIKLKRHKKWDSKRSGEFVEMVKQGYSAHVLADKFHMKRNSVYVRLVLLREQGLDVPLFKERRKLSAFCEKGGFTEEDKQYIKDNTNILSTREMAEWLGCSSVSIRAYQKAMGIEAARFSRWSPSKRMEIIRMLESGKALGEVAEKFETTKVAIRNQLYEARKSGMEVPTLWQIKERLKEKMSPYKGYTKLTEKEIQYILENVGKKSSSEMANEIGCHISTIIYNLNKRHIQVERFSKWSNSRKAELLELRKKGMTLEELAEVYKVSKRAISAQLTIMRKDGMKLPTLKEFWAEKKRNGY